MFDVFPIVFLIRELMDCKAAVQLKGVQPVRSDHWIAKEVCVPHSDPQARRRCFQPQNFSSNCALMHQAFDKSGQTLRTKGKRTFQLLLKSIEFEGQRFKATLRLHCLCRTERTAAAVFKQIWMSKIVKESKHVKAANAAFTSKSSSWASSSSWSRNEGIGEHGPSTDQALMNGQTNCWILLKVGGASASILGLGG